MAVDEKKTFGICLFIDVMVKLSKVKEEEYDHDDKVENRRQGEGFDFEEVGQPHDHLIKSNNNRKK